jgi:hypothetical protein
MVRSLVDIKATLSPEIRARIEARTAELLKEIGDPGGHPPAITVPPPAPTGREVE